MSFLIMDITSWRVGVHQISKILEFSGCLYLRWSLIYRPSCTWPKAAVTSFYFFSSYWIMTPPLSPKWRTRKYREKLKGDSDKYKLVKERDRKEKERREQKRRQWAILTIQKATQRMKNQQCVAAYEKGKKKLYWRKDVKTSCTKVINLLVKQ